MRDIAVAIPGRRAGAASLRTGPIAAAAAAACNAAAIAIGDGAAFANGAPAITAANVVRASGRDAACSVFKSAAHDAIGVSVCHEGNGGEDAGRADQKLFHCLVSVLARERVLMMVSVLRC